jgi:U3 small nucleolar RNA-associated protein 23
LECELFFFVVLKVFEALQEFLFFFLRMGVKKQKQLRRHIRFYKTCFGFREPFKVICDGTFLHYNISKKLGSPQDILPSFLGAAAKAFVTRCVVSELKKMGEAYSGTASAARRFELAKYVLSLEFFLLDHA